jgi:hypothetical protein
MAQNDTVLKLLVDAEPIVQQICLQALLKPHTH